MLVSKNQKDIIYKILSEPTIEKFKSLVENHLGEADYIDFKAEWPEKDKLAKIILALANYGGGAIIIGVNQLNDNGFDTKGILEFKDKVNIKNEISKYLPNNLEYEVFDFNFDDIAYEKLKNKKYQLLIVENIPENLPYVSLKQGKDIEEFVIYTRNGTESTKVNNEELQKILDRRIKTYHISEKLTFNEHLKQLKILYDELKFEKTTNVFSGLMASIGLALSSKTVVEKSEHYPKEDYEEFISKCIDSKKRRIKVNLDIDF
ncbi:MAG TPA: ATP-binding protein [Clostridia bacterium]|nr:ATP-binding protein [Clostridia bacterium]